MEPLVCNEICELLDAFYDGELSALERGRIDEHLIVCADCSRALAEITLVAEDLRALSRIAPARDFLAEMDFDSLGDPFAEDTPIEPVSGCAAVAELLDAYHDGETTAEEKTVVVNHLDQCAPCRLKLEQIGQLVAGLKALPKAAPSRDLAESLPLPGPAEPVSNMQSIKPPASNVVPMARRTTWMTAGAVAAAVAAVFAFNFSNPKPAEVAHQAAPRTVAPSVKQPAQEVVQQVAQQPQPQQQQTKQSPAPVVAQVGVTSAPSIKKDLPTTSVNTGHDQIAQVTKQTATETPAADPGCQNWEVAALSEDGSCGSFSEAMGIATDEDGLYEIKI